MRDFNYDENEEFQNDIDNFFGGGDEGGDFYYDKKDIIKAMEIEIAESEINLKILKMVIQTLERSFWWRFYSFKRKMKMILEMYALITRVIYDKKKEE
jgi:hypothetical protein